MRIRTSLVRAGAAALLLLAACGGGQSDGGQSGGTDHSQHAAPAEEEVAFGEPGSGGGRKIQVDMGDYFFKPQTLVVEAGETVTFVAKNIGKEPHQLVIGDLPYHEQHGTAAGGTHRHASGTGVAAQGEAVEITWTFPDEPMDLLIACHVDDHYARGMIGTLKVE